MHPKWLIRRCFLLFLGLPEKAGPFEGQYKSGKGDKLFCYETGDEVEGAEEWSWIFLLQLVTNSLKDK